VRAMRIAGALSAGLLLGGLIPLAAGSLSFVAPQTVADIVVERKELARSGTEAVEVAPAS